jgi:hypothetical protein
MTDYVNHPPHYTVGRVETIDVIEDTIQHAPDAVAGYLQGQVLKYVVRMWHKKNAEQDGQKACWYLMRLCDHLAAKTRKSQDETLVIGGGHAG